MFRPALVLATATAITLAAASIASAKTVLVSTRVVSNGFTTCFFKKRIVISDSATGSSRRPRCAGRSSEPPA